MNSTPNSKRSSQVSKIRLRIYPIFQFLLYLASYLIKRFTTGFFFSYRILLSLGLQSFFSKTSFILLQASIVALGSLASLYKEPMWEKSFPNINKFLNLASLYSDLSYLDFFFSLKLLTTSPKYLVVGPCTDLFTKVKFFIEQDSRIKSTLGSYFFLQVSNSVFYSFRFDMNPQVRAFLRTTYTDKNEVNSFELYALKKVFYHSRSTYSPLFVFPLHKMIFVALKILFVSFWLVQLVYDLLKTSNDLD